MNDDHNYKGQLQIACVQRGKSEPIYHTEQHGSPNDPSWTVTVKWNDQLYTTAEPIRGNKKHAEQMTAKQVLERLDTKVRERDERREAFLKSPNPTMEMGITEAGVDTETEGVNLHKRTGPIDVPVELMTAAMGMANHRLTEIKRDRRHAGLGEQEGKFAKQLADLTIYIVDAMIDKAKARGIKIEGVNTSTTPTPDDASEDNLSSVSPQK